MSKDTGAGRPATVVHNSEELEPAVCSALASLLATEPTHSEVDGALNKLRLVGDAYSVPVQTSAAMNLVHHSSNRWMLVAACLFVFCICGIASTEVWAQVAKDFSHPLNEPQPLSTLSETTSDTAPPKSDVGFARRLVLIAHVMLLTLGNAGMAVAWLIAFVSCFLVHWSKSQRKSNSSSTQRQVLFYSSLLYAAGIILGAIWAQATWGRFWSWDPRETFGLITLALAALWMRTIDTSFHSELDNGRFSAMSASVATIALGAILLMFVLGNRYAALHSYGMTAFTLPNLVFGLMVGCVTAIWISFALYSRQSPVRRTSSPS